MARGVRARFRYIRGDSGHFEAEPISDDEAWFDDEELELIFGYAEGMIEVDQEPSGFEPVLWLPDPAGKCEAHYVADEVLEEARAPIGFSYGGE